MSVFEFPWNPPAQHYTQMCKDSSIQLKMLFFTSRIVTKLNRLTSNTVLRQDKRLIEGWGQEAKLNHVNIAEHISWSQGTRRPLCLRQWQLASWTLLSMTPLLKATCCGCCTGVSAIIKLTLHKLAYPDLNVTDFRGLQSVSHLLT